MLWDPGAVRGGPVAGALARGLQLSRVRGRAHSDFLAEGYGTGSGHRREKTTLRCGTLFHASSSRSQPVPSHLSGDPEQEQPLGAVLSATSGSPIAAPGGSSTSSWRRWPSAREGRQRGDVAADDAYLGGERSGSAGAAPRTRFPSLPQRSSTPRPPRPVRLDPIPVRRRSAPAGRTRLGPEAHLVTDGLASLGAAAARWLRRRDRRAPARSGNLARFGWVNTSLLTSRRQSAGPTTTSISTSTPAATWPKPSTNQSPFPFASLVGRLLWAAAAPGLARNLAPPRRYKG